VVHSDSDGDLQLVQHDARVDGGGVVQLVGHRGLLAHRRSHHVIGWPATQR
jgi:hypothetical protein